MKFTFEQFVHYGRHHSGTETPWSFNFYGYPVTHETDDRYIIGIDGASVNFVRGGCIVVGDVGEIKVYNP